jgi:hypothetical protein
MQLNGSSRISRAATAALLLFLLAVTILAITGVVHADWYPRLSTYGFSVGTTAHYCYADVVRWSLSAGCEVAR